MNQFLQKLSFFTLHQNRSLKRTSITIFTFPKVITKKIKRSLKKLPKITIKSKSSNHLLSSLLSSLFLFMSDCTIASEFPEKENAYHSRSNSFSRKESHSQPSTSQSQLTFRSDRYRPYSVRQREPLHERQFEVKEAPRYRESSSEQSEDLSAYKKYKRSHKDQHKSLTTRSRFVIGEICPLIRWVNELGCYYGNKRSSLTINISADIHERLALTGNSIKACCAIFEPKSATRNILVPYMSFLAKNGSSYEYKGSYLYFRGDSNPLAFISGPYDYPDAEELYRDFTAANRNIYRQKGMILPAHINLVAGNKLSRYLNKDFNNLNDQADRRKCPRPYNFHTEEWFHEVLNADPSIVTNTIIANLERGSKVCSIIFDIYSWQDACEDCQIKFKQELFQRSTIQKLEGILKAQGLSLPRNGLKIVYRISSERPYHSDIHNYELRKAGGGYGIENGFDIKAIGPAQVTLCTRQNSTYPGVLEDISLFSEKVASKD
ncbi:MAG: hypothetical protein IBJ00_00965 [Alphaproteobacteria bacterium]|nr:hypothetical protein [Alphaproteobacteria bacterium]